MTAFDFAGYAAVGTVVCVLTLGAMWLVFVAFLLAWRLVVWLLLEGAPRAWRWCACEIGILVMDHMPRCWFTGTRYREELARLMANGHFCAMDPLGQRTGMEAVWCHRESALYADNRHRLLEWVARAFPPAPIGPNTWGRTGRGPLPVAQTAAAE